MVSVAVDATPLLGHRTGIGVVVAGFIETVATHRDLELVGYGLSARHGRDIADELPSRVRAARGPMPAGLLTWVWRRSGLAPAEWWTGPVDVIHGTNYVVPPSRDAARLVSVYDMTSVLYPQLCAPASLRYPGLIRRALDQGASVHTLSQTVAGQIVEHFGVAEDRVHVVYCGLKPPTSTDRSVPMDADRQYILALGTVEPRKNFPVLVAAFDSIAGDLPAVELRIAGAPGWGEADLARSIAASPFKNRIHRIGWVDDTEQLISGASVFAFPSLYEGFGIPPLEAMALGVPVVASNAGSLPEILGRAARLVDPSDVAELGRAIGELLTNSSERERRVSDGQIQAARYSWPAAGDGMAKLYRHLSPSSRRPRRL